MTVANTGPPELAAALEHVRRSDRRTPEIGLILGSGLGQLADAVEDVSEFETGSIPGYAPSTVSGHRGRLLLGTLEGRVVAVIQGRIHAYEGRSLRDVTFPVRVLNGLGARGLIVTNAAGGANPAFGPGTLMLIDDHINLAFRHPLAGPHDGAGPRFPDLSAPYDRAWLDLAEQAAREARVAVRRGVYLWTLGPSYETRAEVRAQRTLGADAIGMSTVPEVLEAVYLGMRVLGISTITNPATGLGSEPLDHADVVAVGTAVRDRLERLIRGFLRSLSDS